MTFELSDYLQSSGVFPSDVCPDSHCLGRNILIRESDSSEALGAEISIAIVGIQDDRGSDVTGEALAVDEIRAALYALAEPELKTRIIDLGNLRPGKSLKDTYCALRELTEYLRGEQIIVILIGGSSDLLHTAIPKLPKGCPKPRVTTIAPGLGMGRHPLTGQDSALFKSVSARKILFTNIGHQSCFAPVQVLDYLKDNLASTLRLGAVRTNFPEAEPFLRDSRITGISMDSVRSADAPAAAHPSPNGFYAEEICQLAFYAGNSTHCQVFGIFDCRKDTTPQAPTAQLAAQIVWYFLDGFKQRIAEDPTLQPGNFIRYIIPLRGYDQTLTFYKSRKTDRYWLEAYCDDDSLPEVVACTLSDYQTACAGDLPTRWMKTLNT